MGFTKHTGSDQPLSEAEIIAKKTAEEAKKNAKTGSLIDAVKKAEEDEEKDSSEQ
jgi:hypothetical protein